MRRNVLRIVRGLALGLALAAPLFGASLTVHAADCSRASVGLFALADLADGTYEGEIGGLYTAGVNEAPAAYREAGLRAGARVVPRDAQGAPDPNGKVVLLSVGMSNTTQEFSAFVGLTRSDAVRDPRVVVVDGAQGGQDATRWTSPDAQTWSVVDERLQKSGVTAAQVQAIWLKQAHARPKTDFVTHVAALARDLGTIVRVAAERFPNLQQVFVSPRTYAGYASTDLNPEPYAYESAFAVRRAVEQSVAKPEARPWVGWGPYLWTDGTKGRSDGFVWACEDAAQDGTHPSRTGQVKVAKLLQQFFEESEFTAWYRLSRAAGSSASPPPIETIQDNDSLPLPEAILLALLALAFVGGMAWLALRR